MKEFKNLIVLGPLIYALHHFEEHVIFNFRDWRLAYFADNNPIPTEEVLIVRGRTSLLVLLVRRSLVGQQSPRSLGSSFFS